MSSFDTINLKHGQTFMVTWDLGRRCNYDCSYCPVTRHDNFSPHATLEELKANVEVQNAIKNGFSKAFSTIIDANITTLLVAVILYAIGTGPIKGFAVTLSIGIVTSVFTAIFVTRSLVNFIYGYRDIKELKV